LIQYLLLGLAALVGLLLVAAAYKPPSFRVQRSIRISTAATRIFPHLADFRHWRAWSPWEELDPALERAYGGAESGKSATYAWDGNKKAGAGSMEIIEALDPRRITIDLRFTRPFPAHNTTEFTLNEDGDATEVTWAMHGPQPYLMRLMTFFYGMDKLIGPDFEKGLAKLKTEAERGEQGAAR